MAAAFIVLGYAALIWEFGWWGLAATAAHLAVMLVALPRR